MEEAQLQVGDVLQMPSLPITSPQGVAAAARELARIAGVVAESAEKEKAVMEANLKEKTTALGAARAEAKQAKTEAVKARAEASALKLEVEKLTEERKAALKGQGPMLRAFAERLIQSESFSAFISKLADVLRPQVIAEHLEELGKKMPGFEKEKHGWTPVDSAQLEKEYARILAEASSFPLVEALASAPVFLTAEAVKHCKEDEDADLQKMLAEIRGEPVAELGPEKEAECAKPWYYELEHDLLTKLKEARRALAEKEEEVVLWRSRADELEHLLKNVERGVVMLGPGKPSPEVGKQLKAAKREIGRLQTANKALKSRIADLGAREVDTSADEIQGRLVESEERYELAKEELARISEEHAVYEAGIRQSGGMTISEVDDRVQLLMAESMVLRAEEGTNSKAYKECRKKLSSFLRMYEIVRQRRMPAPRKQVAVDEIGGYADHAEVVRLMGADTNVTRGQSTVVKTRRLSCESDANKGSSPGPSSAQKGRSGPIRGSEAGPVTTLVDWVPGTEFIPGIHRRPGDFVTNWCSFSKPRSDPARKTK